MLLLQINLGSYIKLCLLLTKSISRDIVIVFIAYLEEKIYINLAISSFKFMETGGKSYNNLLYASVISDSLYVGYQITDSNYCIILLVHIHSHIFLLFNCITWYS